MVLDWSCAKLMALLLRSRCKTGCTQHDKVSATTLLGPTSGYIACHAPDNSTGAHTACGMNPRRCQRKLSTPVRH